METNRPLALVTGASSGIGYELAKQFLSNGFDVVITAEDAELTSAAQRLEGLGGSVHPEEIDLAQRDGVDRLYAAVATLDRPLDAAVLNAGVGVGGPFLENSLDDELRLIDLNVVSTVALAKRIASDMVARGEGRILFTSSVVSRMPAPFQAVYGASKAFVQSFGQALRNELKDTGVTVTTLLPGPTDTEFFERAGLEETKVGAGEKDDPALVAEQGFKGMMSGDGNVLGGSLKSRGMGLSGNVTPDAAGAEMNRKMNEPGSAKD
ncbi:short-subunit dehydrogenase [Arthrobacter pigmenti]|uniref:Short-subunit dehydrogenase n=1 Tax=Arthrobacter pigmenti TaxID=271432 RepID=A0A846RJA5_9MICC|nr:SDR family NAD(P)-dependent oxidoreductase [Arthrobacter pigmenti]NJC21249.1 short-subunit dehydrogenase [Arthrobacter pigmenti]